jgi:hypothetical protein
MVSWQIKRGRASVSPSVGNLSAELIEQLARAQGFPLGEAALAERIAAAASAAMAVVEEALRIDRAARATEGVADPLCVGNPGFDLEPGDFLATLERLSQPDVAGGG